MATPPQPYDFFGNALTVPFLAWSNAATALGAASAQSLSMWTHALSPPARPRQSSWYAAQPSLPGFPAFDAALQAQRAFFSPAPANPNPWSAFPGLDALWRMPSAMASAGTPWTAMTPPAGPFAWPASFASVNPWLAFSPFQIPRAHWPMAFFLISAGVPDKVAWPAAEANAATLRAVEAAQSSARQIFSSYRSDGGHAASPVIAPPLLMSAAMAGFALAAPWFGSSMRAFGA